MAKIGTGVADKFCQSDHPECHAILVYGPDEGKARERAKNLLIAAAGSQDDPFQVARINAAQVDETSSLLVDEALQLSLMGGRRAVILEGAADAHVSQIKSLLHESLPLPAQVILLAGELTPRSKLRNLFDKEATLASIATYVDDQRSLGDTIADWSRTSGRRMSREAEAFLIQGLGGDRALTRQELEKLDLYMANEPPEKVIELADVQAIIAGLSTIDTDDALFAALAGNTERALMELSKALDQGKAPEALVATYLYHLTRLSEGQTNLMRGASPRDVVEGMRPPVFFQKKSAVTSQLQNLGKGPLLQRFYLNVLELQKQVRVQRDQGNLYLERFLISVSSACSRR
ncbi:MAG: DNA polymerase III subunit delta [Alphaproteobacteria bacterium]